MEERLISVHRQYFACLQLLIAIQFIVQNKIVYLAGFALWADVFDQFDELFDHGLAVDVMALANEGLDHSLDVIGVIDLPDQGHEVRSDLLEIAIRFPASEQCQDIGSVC